MFSTCVLGAARWLGRVQCGGLLGGAPEGQDVPQDAVVGPAEDELDRWRRREALARAAPGDKASQAQDLFVISAAVLLPWIF